VVFKKPSNAAKKLFYFIRKDVVLVPMNIKSRNVYKIFLQAILKKYQNKIFYMQASKKKIKDNVTPRSIEGKNSNSSAKNR
jgi:hypothetical protein